MEDCQLTLIHAMYTLEKVKTVWLHKLKFTKIEKPLWTLIGVIRTQIQTEQYFQRERFTYRLTKWIVKGNSFVYPTKLVL